MGDDLESNTKAPPVQAPRSRLLLSCGESILAVVDSAHRRVEASRCAAGLLPRAVSRVVAPVLRPLRPRCLSALSFADRHLAAAQGVAAALFPRAADRALAKVDGFVLLVESLPARFDGAADGLEALVAGLRGGNVFRDMRCVDEEEARGAAHRDAEKVRDDVPAGAVAVDGDGGDEDGGAGDEVKTISHVASADKIARETQSDEEMERSSTGSDHLRPSSDEATYGEAAHAEAEEQEASYDEGGGEEDQMNLDAPDAELRDEGVRVEQDGRSMDVVTVAVDGDGGENGGAGDEINAVSRVASADETAGVGEEMERSDTGSNHFRPSSDETGHDDGAAQAAYREAACAEEERQEASSDEGEGDEEQVNFDAPGAEQHDEGVQDGSSMDANAAETTEDVKVESQQVTSPDAGSASETGVASGKESSNDGYLLDLFDQAWQNKLA